MNVFSKVMVLRLAALEAKIWEGGLAFHDDPAIYHMIYLSEPAIRKAFVDENLEKFTQEYLPVQMKGLVRRLMMGKMDHGIQSAKYSFLFTPWGSLHKGPPVKDEADEGLTLGHLLKNNSAFLMEVKI